MMRNMVKKNIKIIGITELVIILFYFYSFEVFLNIQVAFLSSLIVILGASFAYKKMVQAELEANNINEKRDLLDEIEDPYELYKEESANNIPLEDLDLKSIVKEEKAKIKTLNMKSVKHGARGSVSLFRIVPYVFLVLGFIALKNNELLNIAVYLPSLLIGIVAGFIISKGFNA